MNKFKDSNIPKGKRVKYIFNKFYNGLPNPAFPHILGYFKHKNYLCEIARQKSILECKWSNNPYKLISPLGIFEGLLAGDAYVLTVLKRENKSINFHHCYYFHNNNELRRTINKHLNL